MSLLLTSLCLCLLTSIMVLHVHNENNLAKRIAKAAGFVQQLMDQNGMNHIDLEKKLETSSLFTQIRLLEYHLNYLDENYKDFGTKKSIFERISTVESALSECYGYNQNLKLA